MRAAIVILHDGAGSPLPLGSRVTVEGMAGVPTIVDPWGNRLILRA